MAQKKIGRNKETCKRYKAENRENINKGRKMEKSLLTSCWFDDKPMKTPRGTARAARREAARVPLFVGEVCLGKYNMVKLGTVAKILNLGA